VKQVTGLPAEHGSPTNRRTRAAGWRGVEMLPIDPATGKLYAAVRITGTLRDQLAEELKKAYAKGATIRGLADDLGRSYGFVHRIAMDYRFPRRPRGGARPRLTRS
jgi:hypothetical protein